MTNRLSQVYLKIYANAPSILEIGGKIAFIPQKLCKCPPVSSKKKQILYLKIYANAPSILEMLIFVGWGIRRATGRKFLPRGVGEDGSSVLGLSSQRPPAASRLGYAHISPYALTYSGQQS